MLTGVSKTAILTLRARADEHARPDRVFVDPLAAEWWGRVEWPVELDAWYSPEAQYALAFRADDIDRIVARYLTTLEAPATVIELGCGLSTRQSRLDSLPLAQWIDLDLDEVVARRRAWGAGGARHRHIACSVLEHRWMDEVPGDPRHHVFIAEGLLYYLPRAEVDALLTAMRRRFSGAAIIIDVLGANDYPTLLKNTQAVGTPVVWKLEGDYADVLSSFGLEAVPEFEPDRLMSDMLKRYWDRLDAKMRGAIYFARHSELVWRGRSGNILGRLTTDL